MIGFPLLLIPFAIYNIFVFLMPGVSFTAPVASVTLTSGAQWAPTFGDALLALAALLLMFEVIKAARPGARYLTDHLLSLIVSGAAVAEFLLLAPFGTSTFFLLAVLMVVEFFAGVSIGFRNRKQRVSAAAPTAERELVSVPASPVAVSPAPPNRAPVEPSFAPSHPDPRPSESAIPTSQQADIVPAPQPAPPLAVNRESGGAADAAGRKVLDWNVSELVSGTTPDDVKPPTKS